MSSPQPRPDRAVLPRRDRIAIACGLAGVTLLAWTYLVLMAVRMDGMQSMTDTGSAAAILEIRAWSGTDWLLMFLMWAVMMVGMMLPTAAPMTLVYAAVARKAAREGSPLAPTAVFVAGYVAMWTLFSLAATAAQWWLDQRALLSPMWVTTSPSLGAGILIAAGVYQLTPYKNACLEHCRSPAHFIASHWRPGASGAFRLGLEHGAYCLGCCWVLMLLLFAGGVMNLLWIAGIALFVLLEKRMPHGVLGGRAAGLGLMAVGAAALVAERIG